MGEINTSKKNITFFDELRDDVASKTEKWFPRLHVHASTIEERLDGSKHRLGAWVNDNGVPHTEGTLLT